MTTPTYRRIALELRQQIRAGRPGPGEQLPTELELGERYGASRNTARDAIKWLTVANDHQMVINSGAVPGDLTAPVRERNAASGRAKSLARPNRPARMYRFYPPLSSEPYQPLALWEFWTRRPGRSSGRVVRSAEAERLLRRSDGAADVSADRR